MIRYFINDAYSLILYFSLGNDVVLYIILGSIPCLLALCAIFDLIKGQLVCTELNQKCMLQLDISSKELSDNTNYDICLAFV